MPSSPNVIIIIGGGPVGLGAALELARFGVRSVVVEKHAGVATHPKARNFNTRTMEIARAWGPVVYGRLRGIDTPDGWKSPIRFLESAIGREFGQIDTQGFVGPGPDISPAWPIMSSQDLLEQVLLDGVRATGLVDLRFGVEATALLRGGGSGDDGVEIEVRDTATGVHERLVGKALVAADGASSFIRSALGVALEGDTGLSHLINCYFRADIERHIEARKGVILFISNPRVRGVLQPLDARGRWLCQIQVRPEDWTLNTFGPEKATAWIRDATGLQSSSPKFSRLDCGSSMRQLQSVWFRAASSSAAMRPTSSPRPAAWASTLVCKACTTSCGSSPTGCRARRTGPLSKPMTPKGARFRAGSSTSRWRIPRMSAASRPRRSLAKTAA